jgi:hypothetical protein
MHAASLQGETGSRSESPEAQTRDEASSARIDAEKEIEKRIAALQDLYGPLLTGHDTLTKSLSDLDAQLAASTDPDDYDHALASENSRRDVDPACVTKT